MPEPQKVFEKHVQVGQVYRDDQGASLEVVHLESNGDAWVRPLRRKGEAAILTRAAWFKEWELVPHA